MDRNFENVLPCCVFKEYLGPAGSKCRRNFVFCQTFEFWACFLWRFQGGTFNAISSIDQLSARVISPISRIISHKTLAQVGSIRNIRMTTGEIFNI